MVRRFGNVLREYKEPLGRLVTLEMGKIVAEGLGEVQEMIDICDFAVGLSRQLYGLTMHSERPRHRMYEQWHPLGAVGVITAFNFPVAVWAWNAAIAAVCGDTVVWKPARPDAARGARRAAPGQPRDGGPRRCRRVHARRGRRAQAIGERMLDGSGDCRSSRSPDRPPVGRHVAPDGRRRFGRTILELRGQQRHHRRRPTPTSTCAVRAVVFGAVGTAGQRCTSTRRLIVHRESRMEQCCSAPAGRRPTSRCASATRWSRRR